MEYLFLSAAVLCSALLNITANLFNKLNKADRNFSRLYNLIVTASSCLAWCVLFIPDFDFSPQVLPYSFAFGVFYVLIFTGLFYAMKHGSPSLTSFVKQLSLIVVSMWGFVFWKNPLSLNVTIGLLLVLVALYLCFKPEKGAKANPTWLLFSLMLIVGNAGCSIIQKYQQLHFDGNYGKLLMVCATFTSSVICFLLNLHSDRPRVKELSRYTVILPALAGLSSTFLNVFVLKLITSSIPESVFFPVIGVGGIILTTLFSVGIYKEKLSKTRFVGLLVGIVAIVFLNI